MFIILVNYSFGLEIVDKYLEVHRSFLDKYYELGKLVCSGARWPRTGGVIICNADTRQEVHQIISEDPFYINKAVEYEVIEFKATKMAKGLEAMIAREANK